MTRTLGPCLRKVTEEHTKAHEPHGLVFYVPASDADAPTRQRSKGLASLALEASSNVRAVLGAGVRVWGRGASGDLAAGPGRAGSFWSYVAPFSDILSFGCSERKSINKWHFKILNLCLYCTHTQEPLSEVGKS